MTLILNQKKKKIFDFINHTLLNAHLEIHTGDRKFKKRWYLPSSESSSGINRHKHKLNTMALATAQILYYGNTEEGHGK